MVETPYEKIKKSLSTTVPPELIKNLPDKWEKIGEVVIIRLPDELKRYKEQIGKVYSDVLECKTVLQDISGISGVYREPDVEFIYGTTMTETIHKENGIKYKLDPQKIMFSSGNMDERLRMAQVSHKDETVVDLFAGIGYFTLPIAVHGRPKTVFACEINPVAYNYLCDNIVLNKVASIVEPLLGDNRETAPEGVADRVVMGYIMKTDRYLPVAFRCLKDSGGVVHYHDVCPNKFFPDRPLKILQEVAGKYGREAKLLTFKHVKSYAPRVSHVVLDVEIGGK